MSPRKACDDKRGAILEATLQLLAARGFHGFSIKQLADVAGVAAGTVYLYFKDKEALIIALHEEIILRVGQHLFVGIHLDLAPFEQYRLICRNMWQFCENNPEILLSKAQFDHLPPESVRSNREQARQHVKPLSDLFEAGRQSGLIRPLPDEVLFCLGLEPYFSLARQRLLGLVELDGPQLEHIIEATWHSIAIGKQPN